MTYNLDFLDMVAVGSMIHDLRNGRQATSPMLAGDLVVNDAGVSMARCDDGRTLELEMMLLSDETEASIIAHLDSLRS